MTTPAPATRAKVRHVLTGHDLDLICRAAGLPDWTASRDDHVIGVTARYEHEVGQLGRRLVEQPGVARVRGLGDYDVPVYPALTIAVPHRWGGEGLAPTELAQLLAGLSAVAPQLHHDVVGGGLMQDDRDAGVLYLLGVEVEG